MSRGLPKMCIRDRYDIYVIADNCTDDTAKIAASHGANVLVRFNKEEVEDRRPTWLAPPDRR